MMQLDDDKQKYVKLLLRIVVAAYIGFMGVMLIRGYTSEPNVAYLIFGILFIAVAVGFIGYSLIMFKRVGDKKEDNSSEGE